MSTKIEQNGPEISDKLIYLSPIITTYTADALLALIGPAQAGSVSGDCDSILDDCGAGYYAPEENI